MDAHRAILTGNIRSSIAAKQALLASDDFHLQFQKIMELVVASYRAGGRLYIAGNGGSAADAQHLAAEFVSRLARPRAPLPAEALTVDSSILTAIGNDFGFDQVFSRQLEGKMTDKDLFLAITTSGESPNILRALEVCRSRKWPAILLTGRQGGKAKALTPLVLTVPGEATSTIQELHLVVYHSLCQCVEEALFPNP